VFKLRELGLMMQQFSRRALLGGIAAAGAYAMTETPLSAAARRPFFRRVDLPLGLQLYTLGDEPTKDLDAVLAQVAAAGYRDIELPSFYNRKPEEIGAAIRRAGLSVSSVHIPAGGRGEMKGLFMTSAASEIADALGAVGAKSAVAPIALFPQMQDQLEGESGQARMARSFAAAGEDLWKRTAEVLNSAASALKPLGIVTGYHNHNIEFAKIGDTTGWDILMREFDRDLIKLEIDVGWVAAAGLDPVAFMNTVRGRAHYMHVKDVKPSTKANTLLQMDPCEVGTGKQDWARILPAAHRAGVRHFYVEQEPPFTIARMEAARRSADFLGKLRA
jgi:sugar phosphate isomerase/epimerase